MQIRNWDDLRYLLAIKRGRSLSAAAKLLNVNTTTVSRRINILESTVGTPLTHRLPSGSIELTTCGESIASASESAEHHINLIEDTLGPQAQLCQGIVRLTSVPIVINQILTPKIASILKTHPELEIELVPESRDLSLSRREADIAIRLARPSTGGTQIKIRKIGELSCSVYALRKRSAQKIELPWIAYDDTLAHIPPDRWIRKAAVSESGSMANIRVHDAETAVQAVLAGVGKTVLPDAIGLQDKRLVSLSIDAVSKPPARELWLLSHTNQSHLSRIQAVIQWIEAVLEEIG